MGRLITGMAALAVLAFIHPLTAHAEESLAAFMPNCKPGDFWIVRETWRGLLGRTGAPPEPRYHEETRFVLMQCMPSPRGQMVVNIHLDMKVYQPYDQQIAAGEHFSPIPAAMISLRPGKEAACRLRDNWTGHEPDYAGLR